MSTYTPLPLSEFLDLDGQELLAAALALVAGSPNEQGSVTITVVNGHVHCIQPSPSIKFVYTERARKWLGGMRTITPIE